MTRLIPVLTVSALLTAGAAHAQTVRPLAEGLPAGALLTLETRNAAPAFKRFSGVVERVLTAADLGEDDAGSMLGVAQAVLGDSLGREGIAGVFTVQGKKGTFEPALLAVTRSGALTNEMLGEMLPDKPGARVGRYTFSRVDGMFAGASNGLVYVSSDKALLMAYLGRLSGKAAPTLAASAPYAAAQRAAGTQELGLYANFSAAAKVLRSQLAQVMLPRLLSPVVDALDTLGQVAGGLTTTAGGWTTASAQVVNQAGKDKPLARILLDTTDFEVQGVIPASAEAVQATACHPDTGAYLGRWLTRVDLLEPFGFLTDSQLASHLEQAGRYLGGECAQVTLASGLKAGLNQEDPLASLATTVSYQRVTDRAAADAHLPEYARSVNDALDGLRGTVKSLAKSGMDTLMDDAMADVDTRALMLGAGMAGASEGLDEVLAGLKMVYAFRGEYLITAFSQDALDAALADGPVLADDAAFRAAGLTLQGSAGWSYQPNPADLKAQDLAGMLPRELSGDKALSGMFAGAMTGAADLINRFDGTTSQRSVAGNVIIGKASVRYRW
ncbi:hypothetical protein [Deinococcus sedimenti]|uniref:DUF3352 domain-containing protein n=1 Tax=Deinococcus sedimenti TaxID=1867090 RepID=A0ABQ2S892_9DEIO|nr:hypothetical protein [Deinococcus sedimenti]GGR99609.1 hypothetical protein GCM10008960_27850 [Deinococcus sedimenti]